MANTSIRSKSREIESNFRSANDTISNGFDVFKESFNDILLKIQDRDEATSIKARFNVLQRTVIKANDKLKASTLTQLKHEYPAKCVIDFAIVCTMISVDDAFVGSIVGLSSEYYILLVGAAEGNSATGD